jgi:hypothetical protein
LALSVLALVFMLTEMGFAATAFGKRFQIFTIAAAAASLVSGAVMQRLSDGMAEGKPTHWMGFAERITYGSWVLWMAVLAVVLLQRESQAEERHIELRLQRPFARGAASRLGS